MVITFADRLVSWLDRSFVLAYWLPALIAVFAPASVFLLTATQWDYATFLLDGTELAHVWPIVLGFITVTAIAFILQAFTATTVRFYEGYLFPSWLAEALRSEQCRSRAELQCSIPTTYETSSETPRSSSQRNELYFRFPKDKRYIMPTQLGNVLTAAEEYAGRAYALDAILWWPRLVPLLPRQFRTHIDGSLALLVSLLNFATASAMAGLACAITIAIADGRIMLAVFALLLGAMFAWLAYRAAIGQAEDYGNLLRTAFDLYRFEILQQMRLPIPQSLIEEKTLWDALNQWVYLEVAPYDLSSTQPVPDDLIKQGVRDLRATPFVYRSHDDRLNMTAPQGCRGDDSGANARC